MAGIGEILSGSPTVVTSATTVLEAVDAMTRNRTGACVVVDGGELKGVFTERDVMTKVLGRRLDPGTVKMSEVCTTQLVTGAPDTPEHTALRTMIDRHIRHLPVLDGDGKLVGMLSLRKLLQHRVEELSAQLESLHAYISEDALGG